MLIANSKGICQASMCPPVTQSRAAGPADVGRGRGRQDGSRLQVGEPMSELPPSPARSRRAGGRTGCICPNSSGHSLGPAACQAVICRGQAHSPLPRKRLCPTELSCWGPHCLSHDTATLDEKFPHRFLRPLGCPPVLLLDQHTQCQHLPRHLSWTSRPPGLPLPSQWL